MLLAFEIWILIYLDIPRVIRQVKGLFIIRSRTALRSLGLVALAAVKRTSGQPDSPLYGLTAIWLSHGSGAYFVTSTIVHSRCLTRSSRDSSRFS